jgi:hypothetical protein
MCSRSDSPHLSYRESKEFRRDKNKGKNKEVGSLAWEFVDKNGKPLPFHGGFAKVGDMTTTKYVILGVCKGRSGDVYILALHPYSVLKVSAKEATKN